MSDIETHGGLEFTLAMSCPTIHGPKGWPLHILFTEYFACLLLCSYRVWSEMHKRKTFRSGMKTLCLFSLALFLFIKCLFLVVPFWHNLFTDIFLCDQLPRYIMFLSFQFLALWLGGVIFKGFGTNFMCGVVVPVFLLTVSGLDFVGVVVFSGIISFADVSKVKPSNFDRTFAVIDIIDTGTVALSLAIYTLRFFYIFRITKIVSRPIRRRLRFLFFVLCVSFIIFFARFIHSFATLIEKNAVNDFYIQLTERCFHGKCLGAFIYFFIFYSIFDVVAIIFLLIVFTLTSSPSASSSSSSSSSSSTPACVSPSLPLHSRSASASSTSSSGFSVSTDFAHAPFAPPSTVTPLYDPATYLPPYYATLLPPGLGFVPEQGSGFSAPAGRGFGDYGSRDYNSLRSPSSVEALSVSSCPDETPSTAFYPSSPSDSFKPQAVAGDFGGEPSGVDHDENDDCSEDDDV